MSAGDELQEQLGPSRGSDAMLEIYIRYDIDLSAHQLARAFMALDGMYIVLSQPGDVNEWDRLALRDRLSVSQIDTGNSITALFFGAATAVAGVAGLPIVAGAGAVATLAAWLVNRRKEWHEGSKLAAEGAQAKAETTKARVDAMKAASEIADPRIRRLALLEVLGDDFYEALLTDGNVVQLTVNGVDVTDAA